MPKSGQNNAAPNSRGSDGIQSIVVQAVHQINNSVASDGRVIELFVDVWTVAVRVRGGHMNHHLHRKRHCGVSRPLVNNKKQESTKNKSLFSY
jgi:hypothetical protein